jgi:hypothetical protein
VDLSHEPAAPVYRFLQEGGAWRFGVPIGLPLSDGRWPEQTLRAPVALASAA